MNNITVFENPYFGSIRTLVIDGKPFWVAADVAKALGYKGYSDAVRRYCKNAAKMMIPHIEALKENNQAGADRARSNSYIIPEADVCSLVAHSRHPGAKAFEKWTLEEILPQIRKAEENRKSEQEPKKEAENDALEKMRDEIREIRKLVEGQRPIHTAQRKESTVRDYINVMLDFLEHRSKVPRSSILHAGYEYLRDGGFETGFMKAQYMNKNRLNNCAMLDVVVDDKEACKEFVYFLQCNIYEKI